MKTMLTSKNCEIPRESHGRIAQEIERLQNGYGKLTQADIHVRLEPEGYRAEVHLQGKQLSIESHGLDRELNAALNAALRRADKQLRRFTDRLQGRVREHQPETVEIAYSQL